MGNKRATQGVRWLPVAVGLWTLSLGLQLGAVGAETVVSADDSIIYGESAADPVRGGTLTVGMLTEPPSLDHFHQAADARSRVTLLMYQGLMYEHPSGVARPLLAESYTISDDNKTLTFKLRKGVRFHTGQEMTAEDVKYSYDYIRTKAYGKEEHNLVERINIIDDYTVELRMSAPNASQLINMTNGFGGVIPKGYFDSPDAIERLNRVSVGTGPFVLKEFKPNSHALLVRHKDYWQPDLPYLDAIRYVFLPNSASLLQALRNKRIDIARLTRPQDSQQVEDVSHLVIQRTPSFSHASLELDNNFGPLQDKRVRQAIALAIDKEEVLNAAIGGFGHVTGLIPVGMQASWGAPLADLPTQGVDLEHAKKLMAEAGYADGFAMDLTTIIGYDWMGPGAAAIAEQLKPIGINLAIKKVDLGVWIDNLVGRNMGLTFNEWAPLGDPGQLYFRHFHKAPEGNDFRNWNNDKGSALLARGQQTFDYEERKATYVEFQKVLADEVPTYTLFSTDLVFIHQDNVKNHQVHPTGWHFGFIKTYKE